MAETIYIYLKDEGTDVWRPAPAWRIGGSSYIVLRPDDYDADVERWQFPPGSTVECERRTLSGDSVMAAVRSVQPDRQIA